MAHLPPPVVSGHWSRTSRVIASGLIAAHLFVVVVAPWSSPPPSSELSRRCAAAVLPYMKFMSLDNGYRFFAPDPGPSHLLRHELMQGTNVVAGGVFPDRQAPFPRLLYHRYFMVAETVASQMPPPLSPSEREALSPADRHLYGQAQARARILLRSIARHLLAGHPRANAVRFTLQTRLIPSPMEVLQGKLLTDPSFLQEFPLGEFPRESSPP